MEAAYKLSDQLREDREKELQAQVRHFQNRATRAEAWLLRIYKEVQANFFNQNTPAATNKPGANQGRIARQLLASKLAVQPTHANASIKQSTNTLILSRGMKTAVSAMWPAGVIIVFKFCARGQVSYTGCINPAGRLFTVYVATTRNARPRRKRMHVGPLPDATLREIYGFDPAGSQGA